MNTKIFLIITLFTLPLKAEAAGLTQKLLVHRVKFSDPTAANPATVDIGGNAYDRKAQEIAINKTVSNPTRVEVTPAKAAIKVKIISDSPGVVPGMIFQSPANVSLQGAENGEAFISAKRFAGDKLLASVLSPKTVTAAISIMSDTASPTPHTTGLSVADVQVILNRANLIWGSQGNVTFNAGGRIREVQINGSMAALVNPDDPAQRDAIRNVAKLETVVVNIFIVHKLANASGILDGNTPNDSSGEIFLAADSADKGRTLAHELGHLMGLRPDRLCEIDCCRFHYTLSDEKYRVMYTPATEADGVTPIRGITIGREEAATINRQANDPIGSWPSCLP